MVPKQILVSQQLANPRRVLGVKLNVYVPNALTGRLNKEFSLLKLMKGNKSFLTQKVCEWYWGGSWTQSLPYWTETVLEKMLKLHSRSFNNANKLKINLQKRSEHARATFKHTIRMLLVYIICAKSKWLQHHDYGEYKLEHIGNTARPLHTIWPPLLTFNHYKWLLQQII